MPSCFPGLGILWCYLLPQRSTYIWLQPGLGVCSVGDRNLCFQRVSLGAEAKAALFPLYNPALGL